MEPQVPSSVDLTLQLQHEFILLMLLNCLSVKREAVLLLFLQTFKDIVSISETFSDIKFYQ